MQYYSYRTFYYSYVKNFNRNAMKIEFNVLLFTFTYSLSQKIVKSHLSNYLNMINVGFAELKGKQLNTLFLLAPFWLKANIKNVTIYSLKLYT
jgi:hypothetical protein